MTELFIKDLDFGYSEKCPVLSSINLRVVDPGLYCIVGPNGVGKSTLVKCINKLLLPKSGKITIDGRNVADMSYRELSDTVGFVPATYQECFSMPVVNAVMVGRFRHQHWGSTEKDLRSAYRAMKLLGIENLAMKNTNELSAGQLQKVAIARGLAQEPRILVLDEPTSNLDVKYQVYVAQLLRAIAEKRQMIVIMIVHDLNIAARFAHMIIMMKKPGVIHEIGTPADLITPGNIELLYGIDCDVIEYRGAPHVILGTSVSGCSENRCELEVVPFRKKPTTWM